MIQTKRKFLHVYTYVYTYVNTMFTHILTPMVRHIYSYVYTYVNTKDDTDKVQSNVGMTQQCWNTNFTKDDTNKVLFLHVYTYVDTMCIPMFTHMLHLCLNPCLPHVHTYVYTMFTPKFTPCSQIFYTMFTPMCTP